jgi:hypothetical protein
MFLFPFQLLAQVLLLDSRANFASGPSLSLEPSKTIQVVQTPPYGGVFLLAFRVSRNLPARLRLSPLKA